MNIEKYKPRIEKLKSDDRRIKNKMSANRTKFTSRALKRTFWCESMLESMYLHILERDTNIARYEVQPFRLHYNLDGAMAYYRPDVMVVTVDGDIQIKEIKPKYAIEKYDLTNKITAITKAMNELGYKYEVIDEDMLGSKICQDNIRLLYAYADDRTNIKIVDFILSEVSENEIPIAELLGKSPNKQCETLKTIYSLIWHNMIETNLDKRINITSTVKIVRKSNDK